MLSVVHICLLSMFVFFFVSSRRRHTRCALVTGVQRVLFRSRSRRACARGMSAVGAQPCRCGDHGGEEAQMPAQDADEDGRTDRHAQGANRSEERRVGKESVSTCRSRCPPYHSKKKKVHHCRSTDTNSLAHYLMTQTYKY